MFHLSFFIFHLFSFIFFFFLPAPFVSPAPIVYSLEAGQQVPRRSAGSAQRRLSSGFTRILHRMGT
jgi:hypothetical protein